MAFTNSKSAMKAIKQAKILATSLIDAEAPADAASITFLCGLGKEDCFFNEGQR